MMRTDVVELFAKEFPKRECVVTNGTFPLPKIKDLYFYWISIDGDRETHNSIRGDDAWEMTRKNVVNYIEKNGYANIMQDSFLAKGFYEKQLKLWLNNFPKHQILFLTTEELTGNPEKTFKKIFTFLKLPDYKIENYKKQNVGKYTNKMNLTTRNFLIDFYKSHNKKLYELLENNFDCDK